MKIFTKNINGSSGISPKPKAGNGSCWREFWEIKKDAKFNPFEFYVCPGCGNKILGMNLLGCHVKKVGYLDNKWYIVPMCKSCNNKHDKNFFIEETLLVPVND